MPGLLRALGHRVAPRMVGPFALRDRALLFRGALLFRSTLVFGDALLFRRALLRELLLLLGGFLLVGGDARLLRGLRVVIRGTACQLDLLRMCEATHVFFLPG
ncbi:MAG TPA: hypothetical protein VIE63_07370, partial [Ramlibacter sp.]